MSSGNGEYRTIQHEVPRRGLYTPEALDSKSGWDGKRTTTITPIRDKDVLRRVEIDRRFAKDPVPIEYYLTHRPADPRCPIRRASRLQKASAFSRTEESETIKLQKERLWRLRV